MERASRGGDDTVMDDLAADEEQRKLQLQWVAEQEPDAYDM